MEQPLPQPPKPMKSLKDINKPHMQQQVKRLRLVGTRNQYLMKCLQSAMESLTGKVQQVQDLQQKIKEMQEERDRMAEQHKTELEILDEKYRRMSEVTRCSEVPKTQGDEEHTTSLMEIAQNKDSEEVVSQQIVYKKQKSKFFIGKENEATQRTHRAVTIIQPKVDPRNRDRDLFKQRMQRLRDSDSVSQVRTVSKSYRKREQSLS